MTFPGCTRDEWIDICNRDQSKDSSPCKSYWMYPDGSLVECTHHSGAARIYLKEHGLPYGLFSPWNEIYKQGWVRINVIEDVLYFSSGYEKISQVQHQALIKFSQDNDYKLKCVSISYTSGGKPSNPIHTESA